MALSEELNVYKDTMQLLNMLLTLIQKFPRFYRYSLGVRMTDIVMDMLSLIYKANSSYEKIAPLTAFSDKYLMLRALFRICVEQHVITERQYAPFALLIDKIGKQATGWKQYCEKSKKEKTS